MKIKQLIYVHFFKQEPKAVVEDLAREIAFNFDPKHSFYNPISFKMFIILNFLNEVGLLFFVNN